MYVWEQLHVEERGFRAVRAEGELRIRAEYTKISTKYSQLVMAFVSRYRGPTPNTI
jgi:hypothetical protein